MKATGELNRKARMLKTELFATGKKKISLPYTTAAFGAEVTFDTLYYSMTEENLANNQLRLNGKARVSGLDIFHKALSPEVIHLDRGQLTYQNEYRPNHTLELDSTTTVYQQNTIPPLSPEQKRKKLNGTSQLP